MIIWSGKGVLAVLVLLVALLITTQIWSASHEFDIALGAALILAAVFSWFMGRKWNSAEGKVFIDKESGQEMMVKPNHSIFWIKMEYWGVIFALMGAFFIVVGI